MSASFSGCTTKFGLSFEIIDRDRVSEMRRLRGFSVNPWTRGSRFIISHRLLTDEVYATLLHGSAGWRRELGGVGRREIMYLT